MNRQKQRFNIPGVSLSILLANQSSPMTFTAGTKLITTETALDTTTLFQIGSVTKTFTAFLLAKELNNKHLSLNAKLGQFFPEYPKWKDITIEQLVNQTSGIFDYIRSPGWWKKVYAQEKIWQAQDLVNIAYNYPNDFIPGSAWRYSNTNYVLLGMILEKVSHASMNQLMQNLFQRTGLNHTYYLTTPYPQQIMQNMAHGYWQKIDTTSIDGSWLQAAGAAVSTTQDLVRWNQYFYGSQIPFDLKNTITGKSLRTFNEIGYSFGAFRMNTPEGLIWFTPGLTAGYVSMIVYAPCLNAFFAYSANRAPLDHFHQAMMLSVLHQLNQDKEYRQYLKKHVALPDVCAKLKPANQFEFPTIK